MIMKIINFLFISNVRSTKFMTNHSRVIHRNSFKISKTKKTRISRIFRQTATSGRKKFRKRRLFEKIAFHQTIAISKIEMSTDKINTKKIVTNIKIKIETMTKNVIKTNIKIETNIAKKLVIMNDSILDFKTLNFKKRILIIMNMKISMRMMNRTKT